MPESLPPTVWENHRLDWGRQTHVMGIINVTPDSFSGDGLVENTLTQEEIVQRAIAQAQAFVAGGATLIDVGGESQMVVRHHRESARDEISHACIIQRSDDHLDAAALHAAPLERTVRRWRRPDKRRARRSSVTSGADAEVEEAATPAASSSLEVKLQAGTRSPSRSLSLLR